MKSTETFNLNCWDCVYSIDEGNYLDTNGLVCIKHLLSPKETCSSFYAATHFINRDPWENIELIAWRKDQRENFRKDLPQDLEQVIKLYEIYRSL